MKRETDTTVLGICGSFHDSAAVLIRNGRIAGAIEEERVSRVKHDGSAFPFHAVHRLLRDAGLRWSGVDHLAFAWDYQQYGEDGSASSGRVFFERLHRAYARARQLDEKTLSRRDMYERNCARFNNRAVSAFLARMRHETGEAHDPKITFVRHHHAHAASAYYASGFRCRTLVVTLDGYGDTDTTTVWLGEGKSLTLIDHLSIPDSLGWVYASITEYLGFRPLHDEGKVMALAGFGPPRNKAEAKWGRALAEFMDEFVVLLPNGKFRVNPDFIYFGRFSSPSSRVSEEMSRRLSELVGTRDRHHGQPDPANAADRRRIMLAWALQAKIEGTVAHVARHYFRDDARTAGVEAIALAGGVALNIGANSRLLKSKLVDIDRIFIQPAASDAGAALGAAVVAGRDASGHDPRFHMMSASYGSRYTDDEIQAALESRGLVSGRDYWRFGDDDSLACEVANLLARNFAVAWFQGGSEFGPRALGSRSILLRADNPGSHVLANQAKRREWWRPLALSATREFAPEFLVDFREGAEAPFMNLAFQVKAAWARRIRSGIHSADGSTRIQTVSRDRDPLFWTVLNRLGELTGVPAVVNTSFNQQEPLVECPDEALNTFYYMRTIDRLAIGRFILVSRAHLHPTIPSIVAEGADQPERGWREALRWIDQMVPQCHRITASISGIDAVGKALSWPIVKELFGTNRKDIVAAIIEELAEAAVETRAVEICLGATFAAYDRMVYDLVREPLKEALADFRIRADGVHIERMGPPGDRVGGA